VGSRIDGKFGPEGHPPVKGTKLSGTGKHENDGKNLEIHEESGRKNARGKRTSKQTYVQGPCKERNWGKL